MSSPNPNLPFHAPSKIEALFNRAFGFLVGLGLGASFRYLLEVRGRKSGRLYSTPVNLLEIDGRQYLVAPRGETQWVRNAVVTGTIALKRGSVRNHFRLRALTEREKPAVLKSYLEEFKAEVQRYFAVPAGSPLDEFQAIASNYPVFELLRE